MPARLDPLEAAARRRARDKLKKRRKRGKLKAAKAKRRALGSKTSAQYRQIMFGVAPEMSKAAMRAEITTALLNTAALCWETAGNSSARAFNGSI